MPGVAACSIRQEVLAVNIIFAGILGLRAHHNGDWCATSATASVIHYVWSKLVILVEDQLAKCPRVGSVLTVIEIQ